MKNFYPPKLQELTDSSYVVRSPAIKPERYFVKTLYGVCGLQKNVGRVNIFCKLRDAVERF